MEDPEIERLRRSIEKYERERKVMEGQLKELPLLKDLLDERDRTIAELMADRVKLMKEVERLKEGRR